MTIHDVFMHLHTIVHKHVHLYLLIQGWTAQHENTLLKWSESSEFKHIPAEVSYHSPRALYSIRLGNNLLLLKWLEEQVRVHVLNDCSIQFILAQKYYLEMRLVYSSPGCTRSNSTVHRTA